MILCRQSFVLCFHVKRELTRADRKSVFTLTDNLRWLAGDAPGESMDFVFSNMTSKAIKRDCSFLSNESLTNEVGILRQSIDWEINVGEQNVAVGPTGPHKIYLTYGEPTGSVVTERRIRWVCKKVAGKSTPEEFGDIIGPDAVGGHRFGVHSIFGTPPSRSSAWLVMSGKKGDCGTLSTLMKYELDMLGATGAEVRLVFPRHASWLGLSQPAPPYALHRESDGTGHTLGMWFGGGLGSGWNDYEGCCVFKSKWWEGGYGISKNSAYQVLLHVTSPNINGTNNSHQFWSHDIPSAVLYPSDTP